MSTLATYTLTTPDAIPLEQVRRALIIKLRHHGDVLLTTPVFSVLKEHAPHIEIDGLVYADTAPMLSLHPALSQLHTIDRNWKKLGLLARLKAEWALRTTLKSRHYDLIILFGTARRGQWIVNMLRPKWSVAPTYSNGGASWKKTFTHFFSRPISTWRHTVEMNLDALRRIGLTPHRREEPLVLIAGDQAEASTNALMQAHGVKPGKYIHIHPTSRWLFKCWSIEHNAALIKKLATLGHQIVMTAAPSRGEQDMAKAIIQQSGVNVIDLCGQLSLKELTALTRQAQLFIGVDSAPMHMAAAVNTPSVVLFGPSGNLEWGPWSQKSTVVTSARHACRPCGRDGCGGSKISECLTQLPVDQVLEACLAHLQQPH